MKDALNRRSRFAKPQPLDMSIILTDRDYSIFRAMDRHGKLPTNYLYEFSKGIAKDFSFLQRRLTQLYNGFCDHLDHSTKNKDGHVCKAQSYVVRDAAQFNNFQARYQPTVYGITPLAHRLLEEQGGASRFIRRSNSFVHDFFLGCFMASAELQAHRFIFRDEILSHPKCPPATKVLAAPFEFPGSETLVPDDMFGLEYPDGGFRFFAVEVDRGNERVNTRKDVTASIAKKVKAYQAILADRSFTTRFGLPNLTVLFATTNATHMETMVAHVQANVDKRFHSRFLFKAFPMFGENWSVPRELLPVHEPWRSAAGDVDLSKRA